MKGFCQTAKQKSLCNFWLSDWHLYFACLELSINDVILSILAENPNRIKNSFSNLLYNTTCGPHWTTMNHHRYLNMLPNVLDQCFPTWCPRISVEMWDVSDHSNLLNNTFSPIGGTQNLYFYVTVRVSKRRLGTSVLELMTQIQWWRHVTCTSYILRLMLLPKDLQCLQLTSKSLSQNFYAQIEFSQKLMLPVLGKFDFKDGNIWQSGTSVL